MFVGAGKLSIRIPYAQSLKEKRAVVNSIKRKLNNKFAVSVAEVDKLDMRNTSVIGVGAVSSDKNIIMSLFEKIFDFVENNFDVILIDNEFDILKY